MTNFCKRINIICGHYGSGKTNLAVNLAVDLKKQGKDVVLADLDIVNPYFRSADFNSILNKNGIHTISPTYANTNLDIPALTANMNSIFEQKDRTIVIDVGGDDAGAAAMGRYARMVLDDGDYSYLYVINKYRYLTRTPDEALAILREIEQISRLSATGIVNNSNVSYQTTSDTITSSIEYAQSVAQLAGIPLVATAYDRRLEKEIVSGGMISDGYPVDIFVKPPWEEKTNIQL
ncbi:hypothetical protein [Hydrogenoanaerobacterium sp.]|uniref:nucleotide-binding protein n=1 Tax=Hydrogenoanaerobacterium sp. TaxID=2953763 RepID=UPI002896654F|nr:hypothetical protein [Hydrogenoanaerobacterium sp.]